MKPNFNSKLQDIVPALRKERNAKRYSRLMLKQAKCRHTNVQVLDNIFVCSSCSLVLNLTPDEQERMYKKLLLKQRKDCKHNPVFIKETKKNRLFECSLCGKKLKEQVDDKESKN